MTISASKTHEEQVEYEINPNIAAVASTYGDWNGTYLSFMMRTRPEFMSDPYVFWNQPFGTDQVSGNMSKRIGT